MATVEEDPAHLEQRSEKAQMVARQREILQMRRTLHEQEKEFEARRNRLKHEQLEREKALQKQLEERESLFAEREQKLLERQRDFERVLMKREADSHFMQARLSEEIAAKEAELEKARQEVLLEKKRYNEESRRKLEKTSKDYVVEALDILDKKEKQFHRISKIWSTVGAGALLGGIGLFAYISLTTLVPSDSAISWQYIVFAVSKGLIAVGLLAGLAKFAFLFSNSYMREALKNADRRHAINFGKFYLESYGAAAEWSQVKEAFEHWNIIGSDTFGQQEHSGLDFSHANKAASALERLGKAITGLKPAVGA